MKKTKQEKQSSKKIGKLNTRISSLPNKPITFTYLKLYQIAAELHGIGHFKAAENLCDCVTKNIENYFSVSAPSSDKVEHFGQVNPLKLVLPSNTNVPSKEEETIGSPHVGQSIIFLSPIGSISILNVLGIAVPVLILYLEKHRKTMK